MKEKPFSYIKDRYLEIYNMRESGRTLAEIGKMYGLSPSRIRDIYKTVEHRKKKVEEYGELSKLSACTVNALRRYGIYTVEELSDAYKDGRLEDMKVLGVGRIRDIKEIILGITEEPVKKTACKAKKTNEWIPITKQLPPKDGWYLVSLGDGWIGNNLGRVINPKRIHASDVRISKYVNGKFYHGMVTAWMLLPKPYKGEKD